MSASVFNWWVCLCLVSGFNILTWSLSATALGRRRGTFSAELYSARRLQLLLSAGYVFGCAFRSALPVFDVPRICLFDTWLSSVVVGRSVATFAELCFVTQWALLLREISHSTGSNLGKLTAMAIVPLIAIAETCSWYAVLTTSNFWHVAEESIWGLTAGMLVFSLAAIWPRCDTRLRLLFGAICAAGLAYIVFMFLVDVPMYWSRWLEDQASGRHQLSISEGLLDISERRVISHHWNDWKNEIAWMSLYFSVAVWLSIALVHAPVLRPHGYCANGGTHAAHPCQGLQGKTDRRF
jgi:hypothetical protein